jgi:anti-anti-sigma factor
MQYEFGHRVYIEISGSLSFSDTQRWNKMLDELLEFKATRVTLDLGPLTKIDSSGIGLMMVLRDRAEKANLNMIVLLPEDKNVVSILQLANLEALFEVKVVDGL